MRGGGIFSGLLGLAYVIVGAFVAASEDYFDKVDSLEGIVSAILAILLWPLVLLDVNLMIKD